MSVGRATPRGLGSSDGRRRRTAKGMPKERNCHFMSRRGALVHDGRLNRVAKIKYFGLK